MPRCQDICTDPKIENIAGATRNHGITGKYLGMKDGNGKVTWSLFSLAKIMGTIAALIDRNTTCLKSRHLT